MFESWFILALLSIFAITGAELSQKISLTQKVKLSAITNNFFVSILIGAIGIALAFIFKQIPTSLDLEFFVGLIIVGTAYFLGATFYYTSYKSNSASISIILQSISIVVSTILGIIVFNESTGLQKFIGIAIILFAIVYVNYSKQFKFDKYNAFALLGGMIFGIAYTLDKYLSLDTNPLFYIGVLAPTAAFIGLIIKPRLILSETKNLKFIHFKSMLFAGFFIATYQILTFFSYSKGGSVGVVDALNNTSLFLVIIFEIIVFKNREMLGKKLISATLVLIGIILLSGV